MLDASLVTPVRFRCGSPVLLAIILVTLLWSNLALAGDIFSAIKAHDLEQVRSLVDQNPALVSSKDRYGMTPLHAAVREHLQEVVKLLLANKADIEAKDKSGRTPLVMAALVNDEKMAALLVQSNVDVNADGSLGIAAWHGQKDLVELLLNNGASDNLTEINSAFCQAALSHHLDIMELLLCCNADVDTRDHFGNTPLAYASRADLAVFLLNNKADVNATNSLEGGTPLHYAVFRGAMDVSELLIASDANVNARNKRGDTPLHTAATRGQKAMVELLLTNKADVNVTNDNGDTPLQVGFRNHDIAALLRQHGGHGRQITTKPLAGWYIDGDTESPHNQAIIDDYQAYAHKIWPKGHDFFFSEVDFYEDGTGKHAVRIELEPDLREYVEYYLIYDSNNVRTKVIKGKRWHQFHI